MRDKNEGTYRGDTCVSPRLVQKIAEGKTSYLVRVKLGSESDDKKIEIQITCTDILYYASMSVYLVRR